MHLTFDGAAIALYVWVNGVFIGYAEDSLLQASLTSPMCFAKVLIQ